MSQIPLDHPWSSFIPSPPPPVVNTNPFRTDSIPNGPIKDKIQQFQMEHDLDRDINESTSDSVSSSCCLFLQLLPSEIQVHIATYLSVKDIFHLALTHRKLVKLFFNQTPKRVQFLSLFREIKVDQDFMWNGNTELRSLNQMITTKEMASEYHKDELDDTFRMVQQLIWKFHVCRYFPRFEYSAVNIQNWMHVLRRRVAHLKLHSPHLLPLFEHEEKIRKTQQFRKQLLKNELSSFNSNHDIPPPPLVSYNPFYNEVQEFDGVNPFEIDSVENCEWIYKCPLDFFQLDTNKPYDPYSSETQKFCTQCSKTVYKVNTVEELEFHAKEGHCVAFMRPIPLLPPLMGVPMPFNPSEPPPFVLIPNTGENIPPPPFSGVLGEGTSIGSSTTNGTTSNTNSEGEIPPPPPSL
ncbi:hypothetical protein C9374_003203 [Naegleria lovaniensis]|uniref:F-box domain-containing protein n=1 Tax=Naegleria lovaniensis TaxID=51637 RepID=A0AA88GTW8_NAELO|nr:uncharacterized protein C9374_003203 [Naegleria lovaniensis]KAG2386054.1 hypothetical protein C9374_003203 [Naegleria lovaniensis]